MIANRIEPKIDPEFADLCNPLTPEERSLLEMQLVKDGVLEPLCVWSQGGLLLDGHNRLSICKSLKLPYTIKEISVETRHEAINWIIAKQLGRRNATDQHKAYLRGKRYIAEKQDEHSHPKTGDQNDRRTGGDTRTRLAKEYGVGDATIQRDAQFAKAVDRLEPSEKVAVLTGQSGLSKSEVTAGIKPGNGKSSTLAQAKRKLRASEKRSRAAETVSAIATEPVEEIATAKQKRLIALHESMQAIAAIVSGLLADGEQLSQAAKKESWTPHAKTRLRANLASIKRDIASLDQFLK